MDTRVVLRSLRAATTLGALVLSTATCRSDRAAVVVERWVTEGFAADNVAVYKRRLKRTLFSIMRNEQLYFVSEKKQKRSTDYHRENWIFPRQAHTLSKKYTPIML